MEHRCPCLCRQALSFLLPCCVSEQDDSNKRLLTHQPLCLELPLSHGLVFNFSTLSGVKPKDVGAVSSLFPFWILLTLQLWNCI